MAGRSQGARRVTIADIAQRRRRLEGRRLVRAERAARRLRGHARAHPRDRRRARLVPEPRRARAVGGARRRLRARARAPGADARARAVLHGVRLRRRGRAVGALDRADDPARRATSREEIAVYRRWWAERRVDGVHDVDLRVDDPRVAGARRARPAGGRRRRAARGRRLPSVWHDEASPVVEAVRYLGALGHTRIARVAGLGEFEHTVRRTRRLRGGHARARPRRPGRRHRLHAGERRPRDAPAALAARAADRDRLRQRRARRHRPRRRAPDGLLRAGRRLDRRVGRLADLPGRAPAADGDDARHPALRQSRSRGGCSPRSTATAPATSRSRAPSSSRAAAPAPSGRRPEPPVRGARGPYCGGLTLNRISDSVRRRVCDTATKLCGRATQGRTSSPPWIGANFWSRSGGPRMWTRYDRAVVREELAVLAEHGLNVTRSFCYWPDFVPEPGAARRGCSWNGSGISSTRTSSTGSGRSRRSSSATCPARTGTRRGGRAATSTATSGWSSQQAWFAGEIARRFGDHPAVVGWLVSNEMPLYGGPRDRRDEVAAWARLVVQAVRAAGATAADLARRRRLGGRDDRRRQRLLAARARAARRLRRAARLPDGGRRGAPVPDRGVRRASSPAGFGRPGRARGVRRQLRLRRRRARGRVLPAGPAHDAARRRARMARLEQLRLRRPPRRGPVPPPRLRAALRAHRRDGPAEAAARASSRASRGSSRELAPRAGSRFAARRRCSCPSTSSASSRSPRPPTGRTSGRRSCRAYVAAREADLPIALVPRARRHPGPGAALPRAVDEAADGRRARPAGELAHAGATVYLSYFAGSTAEPARARGSPGSTSCSACAHRLRYGLVDPIEDDDGHLRLRRAARRHRAGDAALVRVPPAPRAPARTCRSTRRALASSRSTRTAGRRCSGTRSATARPCSARTRSSTWPRSTPRVNPENTWRLYSALAAAAGVAPAGAGRRPAGARRRRAGRLERPSPSSSTPPATRSRRAGPRGRRRARAPGGRLELGPLAVATLRLSRPERRDDPRRRRGFPATRFGRRPGWCGGGTDRHSRRREGCDRLNALEPLRLAIGALDRRAHRQRGRGT